MKKSLKPLKEATASKPTFVASKRPVKTTPSPSSLATTGASAPAKPKTKGSFWDDDDDPYPFPPPAPITPKLSPVKSAEGNLILIVDQLGKDWKDLLCYHYKMKVFLHLKREDLLPKDTVDASIAYLQEMLS